MPSSYKDDKKPADQQNDNQSQPQAQATPKQTHQINISQILVDFKNTIASIGAPADVEAKVQEYIAMVEDESNKEIPRQETIITSLKTASRLLDDYISSTLKKPSNVVQDWIDAFLLQQVDYKADAQKANVPASKAIESQISNEEKQRLDSQSASAVANYNSYTNYNNYQNQVNSKKQYGASTSNTASSQASQQTAQEANAQPETQAEQPQEKPKKKLKFAAPDGKIYQGDQVIGEKTNDGNAKIYSAEEAAHKALESTQDEKAPVEQSTTKQTNPITSSQTSQQTTQRADGKISANSLIQSFYEKAQQYLGNGDSQKALDSYKKTLNYAKKNNDKQAQAYIIQGIGESYDDLNNLARAAKCFNRVTKTTNDTSLKAAGHNSLGQVYDEAGKYNLAMDHYFESLALNGDTDDTSAQAQTLNNIGKMQTTRYMSEDAVEFFKLALDMAKQNNPDIATMGNVLSNTADAFKAMNKPQSALKYYQKSITCATKADDKETASQTYEKAADLMMDMDKPLKAQSLYKKAMQAALNSKDTEQVRILREKMASLSA
jgi:tetratricopeptide (TPR) repeat protein